MVGRLEIHSNYLILAEVEEGAKRVPKVLPLGSEQIIFLVFYNNRSLQIGWNSCCTKSSDKVLTVHRG